MEDIIIAGQYDLIPERKRYDTLGWYPARYWDVYHGYSQEELLEMGVIAPSKAAPPPQHRCKRCKREIRPEYLYCYHCSQALKARKFEEARETSRARAGTL